MILYMYDGQMNYIGSSEDFYSVEHTSEFSAAGEIQISMSPAVSSLFPGEGFAVTKSGDVFVTERIRRGQDSVTAYLRGGAALFSRCVVTEDQRYSMTARASAAIESTVKKYGGSVFPKTLSVEKCLSEKKLRCLIKAGSLYDAVINSTASSGLGFRLSFTDGAFVFALRDERDSGLHLWDKAGTLGEYEYNEDTGSYKNRAIVRGDSEESGAGTISVQVDAADCGFDDGWDDGACGVRSIFADASDIKRSDYTTVLSEEGPILLFDRTGYNAALKSRGAELLAKRRPRRSLSFVMTPALCNALRPGDIFEVRCGGFSGIRRARVTRVMEKLSGGAEKITAEADIVG